MQKAFRVSKEGTIGTVRVIRSGKIAASTSTKPGAEATLLKDALELSEYGTSVDYCFSGPAELNEIELAGTGVSKNRAFD